MTFWDFLDHHIVWASFALAAIFFSIPSIKFTYQWRKPLLPEKKP